MHHGKDAAEEAEVVVEAAETFNMRTIIAEMVQPRAVQGPASLHSY